MTVPAELILQPSELGQLLTDTEYNCVNTGSSWSMYFIYAKPQLWLPPTKGGWKRSYSIYYIHTRRRSEAQQRWSRLNSFLSYWQKYSPLKFVPFFPFFSPLQFCNIRPHGKKVGEREEPSGNPPCFSSSHPCRGFPPLTCLPAYSCFVFSLIRWLTREQTQSVRNSSTENTPC